METLIVEFLRKEGLTDENSVVFRFGDLLTFAEEKEPTMAIEAIIIELLLTLEDLFIESSIDNDFFITGINISIIKFIRYNTEHLVTRVLGNTYRENKMKNALLFVCDLPLLKRPNNVIEVKTKYPGKAIGRKGKNIKKLTDYINFIYKTNIKLKVVENY